MQDLAVDGDLISRYPQVLTALSLGPDYRMKSAIILNNLVQCSLAFILRRLIKIPHGWPDVLSDYLSLAMMAPSILAMASLPSPWISWSAILSNLVPATLLGTSLGLQADRLHRHLSRLYLSKRQEILNYGLNTFLEAEWVRLQVPSVLRLFWLSRLSVMLATRSPPVISFDLLKTALITGSDTLVSVLGMTSVVSTVSHWVGLVFQLILSAESEEEKSVASVSAVLFFVLALQTGLTGNTS